MASGEAAWQEKLPDSSHQDNTFFAVSVVGPSSGLFHFSATDPNRDRQSYLFGVRLRVVLKRLVRRDFRSGFVDEMHVCRRIRIEKVDAGIGSKAGRARHDGEWHVPFWDSGREVG